MAPPRKQTDDPVEALRLEKLREKNRRRYQRKRLTILARNKKIHEENKEKYGKRKAEKAKQVLDEVKLAKKKYEFVVPCIQPTVAALGGHFAGDGCCLSDSRSLSVFTMDLETAVSYEGAFGGSTKKNGNGYLWRTNAACYRGACEDLLPFALTKSNQIRESLNDQPCNETIRAMKSVDYVDEDAALLMNELQFDQFLAGFFTADGHCTSRGKGMRAYIVLGQKHPAVLRLISSRYHGGSEIKPYNPTANGSKVDKNGDKYEAYQLTYSGEPALAILKRIYPWILAERVKKSVKRAIDLHERE